MKKIILISGKVSVIIVALLLLQINFVYAIENSDIVTMINHHMEDANILGIATGIMKNNERI